MSEEYNKCFICGKANPDGLQLDFEYPDNTAIAVVNLPEKFAGYPGIIHGGMVAALLDESMAKIVLHAGTVAVTGRMSIEYKRPVNSLTDYLVSGEIVENKGRIITCKAKLTDPEGKIHARAEATFVRVKDA